MVSNTERIIPSGLSVFGWYTRPDEDGLVSVHVDVGFGVGKFGGLPSDQIEFELCFRRAEIVVICGGGAEPKFSTMARQTIPKGIQHEQMTQKASGNASAQLDLALGQSPSLTGGFGGEVSRSKETTTTLEIEQAVSEFLVRHQKTSDGHAGWEVRARNQGNLDGNPWDPVAEPRLKVRMPPDDSLAEPTIRVEVRCRGEDLEFGSGIKLKRESKRSLFDRIGNKDKNLAAAEQFLKSVLEREGLSLAFPSEKYGEITIADVVLTLE